MDDKKIEEIKNRCQQAALGYDTPTGPVYAKDVSWLLGKLEEAHLPPESSKPTGVIHAPGHLKREVKK